MGGADFDAPLPAEAGDAPILLAEGEGLRGSGAGPVSFASFASVRFSPLPASTREVEEVAALWRGKGHDALVLTGALATEAAFKAAAPARRILHVATHGFFLGGDARPGAPGGRGIGSLTPAGRKGGASRSDARPLRLSGLTFAGANRRAGAAPGAEDGILTAEEIAALDLSRVEWAVLSACDTGAGEVRAGEGILGLRRAFQVAGAGTLVLTLWPVFDADARDFMTALHASRLSKGSDAAEAARDACLEVLRSRRERGLDTHPFHWAAFVAAGR
ncbi:MAG TPA: CHAT domain-containing protein, partial [Planctomycetota bacterium]|nr:CHAT domain-containing protein [Planctomycetota bacterium]